MANILEIMQAFLSIFILIKLTQIGNSVGLILPKEVLAKIKLEKCDRVFLTDTLGGVTIIPHDPFFKHQLEVGASLCASIAMRLRLWLNNSDAIVEMGR